MMLRFICVTLLSMQCIMTQAMDDSLHNSEVSAQELSVTCVWPKSASASKAAEDQLASILPFTISKEEKIVIHVPEEIARIKKAALLGKAVRDFYLFSNQKLDIRPLESAIVYIYDTPVSAERVSAREKAFSQDNAEYLNAAFEATSHSESLWPVLMDIENKETVYSDYLFIKSPQPQAVLPIYSYFDIERNGKYQQILKSILSSLLSPDFVANQKKDQGRKRFVNLEHVLPAMEAEIQTLESVRIENEKNKLQENKQITEQKLKDLALPYAPTPK